MTASDGLRLAWADVGEGLLLVKAANWLSHLEYDWDSPVWRHWIRFFSDHFRFVRFDERGCGMSDWNASDLSVDRWVEDLEGVVDAAKPAGPVILLGISQGAAVCIAYAARHRERVSHLVLHGSYARGSWRRGIERTEQQYRAMVDLARIGWGQDNPTFRQVFTSRFMPGGSDEQLRWFNDLCLKTTTGDIAARLFEARALVDVTNLLAKVQAPTLVLHARDDEVTPIVEGRLVAALGVSNKAGEDPAFGALSPRERQILGLIADGLSNAEIAERLGVSEKTVRNHTSNVFDKLGVWTRAQAIVFARERHFSQ